MFNISVIIPLYNKKEYIVRAINSILNQTYRNFELILIDDGSTDNGANEVQKIKDNRIKIIYQNNQGVSAARNRGINEAKSELIAFLDADDAWKPDFLEVIMRLRNNYPQAGAYGTAYEMKNVKGKTIEPKFIGILNNSWEGIVKNYFQSALISPLLTSSSTAIPKNIFNIVGYFAEDMPVGEDLDMWCRIALKFPIVFSNKICSVYYQNADDRVCNKLTDCTYISILLAKLEKQYNTYKYKKEITRYFKEYIIKRKISLAREFLVNGKLKEARDILTKCRDTEYFKRRWSKFYLMSLIPNIIVKSLFYLNRIIKRIWELLINLFIILLVF